MSLFAAMSPQQQMALKQIQQRQLLARRQQATNKYIPNSGWTGVLAQVYKGYLANKDLDSQEQKQKGILKQIAEQKKERLKALGVMFGVNAPDKPKAPTGPQQQAPQQVPQQAMAGVPGVGQTPAPQIQPQVNTAPVAPGAIPQAAPQQADSPATKMIKMGLATQNEKLIMQGMQMKAKEGQMSSGVGKVYSDIAKMRAAGTLTPQIEAHMLREASQKGKASTVINNNLGKNEKSTKGHIEKDAYSKSGVLDQLSVLKSQYKPHYHERAFKGRMYLYMQYEKNKGIPLIGGKLTPAHKAELKSYKEYASNQARMFGLILKDLSGVAINPTEFKRAQAWIPNKDDSPSEASAKLAAYEQFTRRALLRANYAREVYGANAKEIRRRGSPMYVPLDAIEKLVAKNRPDLLKQYNVGPKKEDAQKKALLNVDTSKMNDKEKLKYLNQLKKLNNQ